MPETEIRTGKRPLAYSRPFPKKTGGHAGRERNHGAAFHVEADIERARCQAKKYPLIFERVNSPTRDQCLLQDGLRLNEIWAARHCCVFGINPNRLRAFYFVFDFAKNSG